MIFHSDRGSEYTSRKFGRTCRKLGVFQSMGRVGSCFGNAVSEAFNSVLKVEYVHRRTFATRAEARIKIATWITDLLQRPSAAQRVRLQESDRLRTRVPDRPHHGAGRIANVSTFRGDWYPSGRKFHRPMTPPLT